METDNVQESNLYFPSCCSLWISEIQKGLQLGKPLDLHGGGGAAQGVTALGRGIAIIVSPGMSDFHARAS